MVILRAGVLILAGSVWLGTAGCREVVSVSALEGRPSGTVMEFGESSLPAEFTEAVGRMAGAGLWPIEGKRFVSFRLVQGQFPGDPVVGAVYQGWLMEEETGGKAVLSVDGRFYEAGEVVGDADLSEEAKSPSDPQPGQGAATWWVYQFADPLMRKAAMWLVAGKTEWAEKAFEGRSGQMPGGSLPSSGFGPMMLNDYVHATSDVATILFCRGETAGVAWLAERASKAIGLMGESERMGVFDREYLTQLAAEGKRRAERSAVHDVSAIKNLPPLDRRRALIAALEDVGAPSLPDYGGSDPISAAITAEGEAMIPWLIEAYASDERLTRQLQMRFRAQMPQKAEPVWQVAATLLYQIWRAYPALRGYGSAVSDREVGARAMSEAWEAQKHLSEPRRMYWAIANEGTSMQVAESFMGRLFEPAAAVGGVRYVPGRIPTGMDQLLAEEREELPVILERRILGPWPGMERGSERNKSNLAIRLAQLRGVEALPVLRQYTANLLAEIVGGSRESGWNQFGPALGAVVSQRVALGDREAALKDFRAVIGGFDAFGPVEIETLRPAWEHPGDRELQGIAREALERIEAKVLAERPKENVLVPDWVGSAYRVPWMGSAAFREYLAKKIGDRTEVGTVEWLGKPGDGAYRYKTGNRQGGGSVGQDQSGPYVEGVSPIVRGDVFAFEFARRLQGRTFEMVWTAERRAKERAALVRDLRNGRFDWSALMPESHGGSWVGVYRLGR